MTSVISIFCCRYIIPRGRESFLGFALSYRNSNIGYFRRPRNQAIRGKPWNQETHQGEPPAIVINKIGTNEPVPNANI